MICIDLLWFVSGPVLQLLFWYGFGYDFNMVSVCFSYDSWSGSELWFWRGFGCYFRASWDICKVRKCGFLNCLGSTWEDTSSPCQNRIKIVSESYQNHIFKKILKSYQNHKNHREIDQTPVAGCFGLLFWSQPTGTISKSNQNHIKIVPNRTKSYQQRIKMYSYQSNIKLISKIISKPQKPSRNRPNTCPWLFRFPFLKPTHWEPWKRRSVPKPYQSIINHL